MNRRIVRFSVSLPNNIVVPLRRGYKILTIGKGFPGAFNFHVHISEPETGDVFENVEIVVCREGDTYDGNRDAYISSITVDGELWHVFERKLK